MCFRYFSNSLSCIQILNDFKMIKKSSKIKRTRGIELLSKERVAEVHVRRKLIVTEILVRLRPFL